MFVLKVKYIFRKCDRVLQALAPSQNLCVVIAKTHKRNMTQSFFFFLIINNLSIIQLFLQA